MVSTISEEEDITDNRRFPTTHRGIRIDPRLRPYGRPIMSTLFLMTSWELLQRRVRSHVIVGIPRESAGVGP